jgi:hypothetical protein
VLALQAAGQLGLAQEPLNELTVVNGLGKQQLDRHGLLQVDVHRLHHDAHATAADHTNDPILAREHRPGLDPTTRRCTRHVGVHAATWSDRTPDYRDPTSCRP